MIQYLVTTDVNDIPDDKTIIMVDGTVPGWDDYKIDKNIKSYHWDHHRHNGGMVQIDELPTPADKSFVDEIVGDICIVTTLCDADAAVAATFLQLSKAELTGEIRRKLRAIALDCDYLCIPPSESEYQYLAEFAAKAVAAMKEESKELIEELELPKDRKVWSKEEKRIYSSIAFENATKRLITAVKGFLSWPGELGKADSYFTEMQKDIEALRQLNCVRLINGVAVLDMRSINKYIDPRCLVALAKELGATEPITLTARTANGGTQYTLGSLPYHPDASKLDLTTVFPVLAVKEADKRLSMHLPEAATTWGGRSAVGGSGWNDYSVLSTEEVIDTTLALI